MTTSRPIKAFDNPDFMHSREARVLRIISEYIEPEKRFAEMNVEHTVVFFGSARSGRGADNGGPGTHYYNAACECAYRVALLSREIQETTGSTFYICTGGGPGIMEAANKGAARAGLPSIGLNIELPFEQVPNEFITPELSLKFHYFFMRKLWFVYQAKAIIVFPGGFGTMDELFETLTLVQTRKLEKMNIPILLYDKSFWESIINFDALVEKNLINPEDLDLFHYFSEIDEAIEYLRPRLTSIIKNIDHYLEMKFPI